MDGALPRGPRSISLHNAWSGNFGILSIQCSSSKDNCSRCNFTAQFESALTMHRQLFHDTGEAACLDMKVSSIFKDKSNTLPRAATECSHVDLKNNKNKQILGHTSSATKIFNKLRARISRSKLLFSHPEETIDTLANDIAVTSKCTSKDLNLDTLHFTRNTSKQFISTSLVKEPAKETYGCHLCNFDADRITVLDRHLLNDHKIGLDNLLKLVLAKTKDGLSDEPPKEIQGIREPYYRLPVEIIEEGEFIIETVTPKIKILKHASTNTEQYESSFKDNCKMITKELEELSKCQIEECNKNELIEKMNLLKDCMCKYVDSSRAIKNVLAKELQSKHTARDGRLRDDSFVSLGLGDLGTPRDWERAHSEEMERSRFKYGDKCSRSDKCKTLSESFYF